MNVDKETTCHSLMAQSVLMPAERALLTGELALPKEATGLVVLIQGDNRGRPHTYNNIVAKACHRHKLATLLVDFPSFAEGHAPDIFLSKNSMEHIARWLQQNPETAALPLGFFAAGSSVSELLFASATHPNLIRVMVLSGGRPDTAIELLPLVKTPVLLIAGGRDHSGLQAHQAALGKLNKDSTLHVIPRATHSFEEQETMEEAAQLAALCFSQHLG